MLTIDSKNKPDVRKFEEILYYKPQVYFDKAKLRKKVKIEESYFLSALHELKDYIYYHTGGSYSEPSRANLISFLLDYCHVPEFYLESGVDAYGNKKYSINRKQKLDRVYMDGFALDFLDLYFEYTELKASKENMSKMMSRLKVITEEGTGRELLIAPFKYSIADTGRYCTNKENIQAVKRLYLDCMTVHRGRFLFWADFDQMDLRVAWNVMLSEGAEDDRLFDLYDDKYKSLANIVCRANDIQFNNNLTEDERGKYKLGTLARTYGCSLKSLIYATGDKDFAKNLDKYFRVNKRYKFYEDTIDDLISAGNPITIHDYFGVQRVLANSGYSKDIKTKCLNTPIQSTSNSILMSLLIAIIDKYRSLGFGPEDVHLYLDRHDEFLLSFADHMKDYLYIMNDFMTVCVDDWSPLTLKPKVGYHYKKTDDKLMSYLEKPFKETERKPILGKNYFPIRGEETLTAYVNGNKFVIRHDKLNRTYMHECTDNVILHLKRFIETQVPLNSCNSCKVFLQNCNTRVYSSSNDGVNYEYILTSDKSLHSTFCDIFDN